MSIASSSSSTTSPVAVSLRPPAPRITANGIELDPVTDRVDWLRDSSDVAHHPDAARQRIADEGYLFLPGHLDRDEVFAARREITARLERAGHLAPGTDPMLAIPSPQYTKRFAPELAKDNPPLEKVLYSGAMMKFFRGLFNGPVLHFDYTWLRAIPPGRGTPSHCDSVYMNRGTQNLFTAWTPMGDTSLEMGGLMVLEGSNNLSRLRETYCKTDVDSFCVNRAGKAGQDGWARGGGVLSKNPRKIVKSLGGRWLTTEYRAGDVLVFSIFTVHASLDNRSSAIRLSSDSRYQPAGEAADPRWIGEHPIGHSAAGKRGKIC